MSRPIMKLGTRLLASALLLSALPVSEGAAAGSRDSQDIPRLDGDWPTYHGDNTGQRHSPLTQIDSRNVGSLALSWVYHAQVPADGGFLKPSIKSTPIERYGVLYFSMPNQVWA